jgi:class 3 adenylate cyclase/tetratricopeptide (TPR) repeat protein
MTFEEMLDHAITMLQRRGRLTYGTLKRQFQLDDAALADLTEALIYGQGVAADEGGRVLVWTGAAGAAPLATEPPASCPDRPPRPAAPAHLVEKMLLSRSALEGERKQVTVLFADLKGSMELLAERDPEEARQLLDPVLERMMAAVHRYEGTVNQVMGDGIMALFGAPIAHEEHALRACYAALAMQEALRAYADQVRQIHQVDIQIRVGLNSGEVVVRAIGNDLHMDYSAIGQTTHLAARMEQLARPGSILLTTATCRLAAEGVQAKSLGLMPIKGLAQPLEVFELAGAGPPRTRLQAFAVRTLTRFVGRQAEREALRQAHARAGAGHGQLVAVMGEPGVGKSRLCYECLCAPWTQGWLLLASQATAYGQATPYHPVRELLNAYFQLEARDDAGQMRARVTRKVRTLDPALAPTLPAVLALLDIPGDDRAWQALDPPQRRQRTLDALTRLLLRESQVQPVLLVCENLHWIDTETQAFLDRLSESLPTARLLLLVTYRPEYQHGWGSKTSYTHVRLDPLPPVSAGAFVQTLLGDDPSLAPLTQLLMARTEGNPFFLEESVRHLVETGLLVGELGAYRLAQALPTLPIPATVHALLAARIDRLPPEAKHLLQTAAVIGTEVPVPLLQTIAELPEDALDRSLTHVQGAEFLYETRLFPERAYTFTHALTQEVAASSLLRERRRVLHARIVEALEALGPERRAEQVDRLAYHALRGEVWEKAVAYGRQAGAKALDRAAFREAVAYFAQALQGLAHLPEGRDTRVLALELHLALAGSLDALGEYGRLLALVGEAEALALALDDRARLVQVLAWMVVARVATGDSAGAMTAGQQALALAGELGDHALQGQAALRLGNISYARGDFGRAAELLRESVEAADRASGTPSTDVRIRAQAWLALTLSALGAFAEGRRHGEEALRRATLEGRGSAPIMAHACLGLLYLAQGDLAPGIRVLNQGLALCRASGNQGAWVPAIMAGLGSASALQGHLAEGRALLEEAIRENIRQGARLNNAVWVARLSEVCQLAGCGEEAGQYARQALDLARQHKARVNEAFALLQCGAVQAHAAPPEAPQAVAHYQQALALAAELGMRPLQAHCHRGLGTLYAATGQREQARSALSTAIEMYRAMDMTFWLPQAEAMLAEVSG